jgi:hypothetical protein
MTDLHVPMSQTDAAAVSADAFVFGYPLVLSDRMRTWMTAPSTAGSMAMRAPVNEFVHARMPPDATTAAEGGHHADTLRSSAWLDLDDGPVVLTVPDTHGRYYVMSMVDLWTNTFASVGARTTGTGSGAYLIEGPRSTGPRPPAGMLPVAAPTRIVRLIGLTQGDAIDGYAAAHGVQDGYRLAGSPGRARTGATAAGAKRPEDRTPPVGQVERMDARTYFSELARLMRDNPPRLEDSRLVARMRQLGILPDGEDGWDRLSGEVRRAAERGARLGLDRVVAMAEAPPGEPVGDWRIRFRLGQFGTDYLGRAGAACAGLEAGPAADELPALIRTAADGRRLTGRRRYVLRFAPGGVPPVHGFWTLTTYDDRQALVDNPVDCYSIGDWNGLNLDSDGSVRIHIQHRRPPEDGHSNWLPSPPGPFNLLLARAVQPAAPPDLAGHRRARPALEAARRRAGRLTPVSATRQWTSAFRAISTPPTRATASAWITQTPVPAPANRAAQKP